MFLYSICFIITYIIVLCCHNIVVINIKWWYVIMITWSCHNLVMLSPWFFMICTPFHQGTESPCAAATLTAYNSYTIYHTDSEIHTSIQLMVVDAIWCGTLWLMSPLLLASTERRERSTVTVSVSRSEGLQSGLALRKMPGCKPKNTNIALKQCV